MTIVSGPITFNRVKTWTKTVLKHGFTFKPDTNKEWDSYFASYCKCRDSLTWHNLDGSVCQGDCTNPNINIAKAVKNSIVSNPTTAYILCIDEGVQDIYASPTNISICVPGCGILMSDSKDKLVEIIAKSVKNNKISKVIVTSHSDCGAAGLATEKEFEKIKEKHTDTFFKSLVEIVAEEFSKSMADLIKDALADTEIKIEVLNIKRIDRPKFHHAFGAVLNFVPKLNIGLLEENLDLPMFGISADILDDETARRDTVLAYKIASGSHGFSNKFNDTNPFEVIACVDNENDIERAQKIFKSISENYPIKYSIVDVSKM